MVSGGKTRAYGLYIPTGHKPGAPLLVSLHGATESANVHAGYVLARNTLAARGDKKDMLVVYPQGLDKHWNDGRTKRWGSGSLYPEKDLEFIEALIAKLKADPAHAPKEVYLWGMSNGGMMALRMACASSVGFKGIVAVSALAHEGMKSDGTVKCTGANGKNAKILLVYGGADGVMRENDTVALVSSKEKNLTLDATANLFCSSMPATAQTIDAISSPAGDVLYKKEGCGGRVVSLKVAIGDHHWFDANNNKGKTKELVTTGTALSFLGFPAVP